MTSLQQGVIIWTHDGDEIFDIYLSERNFILYR